ncbi:hypothetical protein [Nocardia asteroides]|uniref:hypothetical protein n=1 Tax=Nocardia asteroides TaxID=1824 RepID=UPI001E364F0C|nr:hypothetical protein [Nocardia asteroides]UGT60755.1 hypothetical protein LTT61_26945 [Nocardia asteroides]
MRETYTWLREVPLRAPTVLGEWDGVANILLFPIPSGALLWWMFEDHAGASLGAFVHLTDHEAQVVFEHSGADAGLLEPVRETLTDPNAVVWSITEGTRPKVAPFRVVPYADEEAFTEMLWNAAEATMEPLAEFAEQAYALHLTAC